MVEPQIVVLVVAGSSPVGHPLCKFKISNFNVLGVEDLGLRSCAARQRSRARLSGEVAALPTQSLVENNPVGLVCR